MINFTGPQDTKSLDALCAVRLGSGETRWGVNPELGFIKKL